MTELRRTVRTLTASPGFTIAVLATLVTAVALETTTLSVVNAYLVRSLPYPASDRLYRVTYGSAGEPTPRNLEQADWRSASDVVEEQIAWDLDVFYLMGGEYPEPAPGEWVTPGFMRGLGVQPALGRSFRDEDFVPGAQQVALISDELWRRRFAGDSAVLGRTFSGYVSDRPQEPSVFTIVGVLPRSFWHVNGYTQILAPLREAATYPYFIRLRQGISPTHAAARISTLIRQTSPGLSPAWQVQLESVHHGYTRSLKPLLTAVAAAVTLVLLIACANVTLLMVLRGMQRGAEIAVRVALGASGRHIARLLIGESLVLCATAAAGGAVIAAVVLRVLAPMIEQQIGRSVPGGSTALAVDGHVAGAVALIAVFMTVATALPPLLVTRTRGVFRGMAARATDGQAATRARSLLVSLQVAGSFGLLVGCALTVRTIRNLVDVRTGMRVERVVEAGLATRDQTYPTAAARVDFHERLLDALERAPGVSAAALSSSSPLLSLQPRRVAADDAPGTVARASTRSVSTNWLTVLGVSLIDGRAFTSFDRVDAEPVAIVSESLARALWPRSRAVGQRVRGYELSLSRRDSSPVIRTVVGVVRDVRQAATDSLISDMYVPMLQAPTRFASIAAMSNEPMMDWTATLRRAVRSVDPEATVSPAKLLSRSVDDQMRRPRFLAWLFTAFGIFAFGVGIIGVYAVTAYGIRQREREIAVRIAVGADRRSVVRMFVQQAGGQLTLGLALGCVAAFGVRRVLAAELFGTGALEPLTFAVVGALIGLASSAAVAWPAWRAGSVNPTTSLRA